jgi:hypothetical protein
LELQVRRGVQVSSEPMRRWLHELGWVWKRAKLVAKDDGPQRVEKLARIRLVFERLPARAALFFADELDIPLLPKVGYQWMPKGEQVEVLTSGTNEKRYLAGALEMRTGAILHRVWWRKTHGLFLDLLQTLDRAIHRNVSPASMSWLIIIRFTKHGPLSGGWRRTPASSCCSYLPIVRKPARLNELLAMSTISVPAITNANGCGVWSEMWSSICPSMGPGHMYCQKSTIPLR